MNKINYTDLVKNFKSISISIDMIIDCCLYENALGIRNLVKSQDGSLERFICLNENVSFDDITSITVRKDGLYYNLRKALSKICDIYKINKCDKNSIKEAIDNLSFIRTEEEINNFSANLYKKYKMVLKNTSVESFKMSVKRGNIKNNQKRTIEERKLKNEFWHNDDKKVVDEYKRRLKEIYQAYPIYDEEKRAYELIVRQFISESIEELNRLLKYSENNFSVLSKVSNNILEFIDFERLGFMIAITVKDLAIKNKDDEILYKNALIYLKNYIQKNRKMVDDNYTLLKKYNNAFGISGIKKYEISSILDFINNSVLENKEMISKDEGIEKYDYSFLECGSIEKSREVLCMYRKLGCCNDEALRKLLNDKIDFYESLGYKKVCVGQDSFDGYLGFCLDNGVVILDKMYDDLKTGKIATDQAVYVTTIDEFDKVTRLTKTECIEKISKKELNVKRIIHSGGWQERVIKTCKQFIKK